MKSMVKLTEEARQLVIETRAGCAADIAECATIEEALEHELCNGWSVVRPEECGALTDGLILTREDDRDESGALIALGTIYWDDAYQIQDSLEELREHGRVTFKRVD